MSMCRGIRGATTADSNTQEDILSATKELLEQIIADNHILPEDVATVILTTTPDIDAAFPARAVRMIGWSEVASLGAQELGVPDALKLCIRILILWNTDLSQAEIKHVYLRGATNLRPDRAR